MARGERTASLDHVPDPSVAYDRETGEIREVNGRLCDLVDRPAASLVGRDVRTVVVDGDLSPADVAGGDGRGAPSAVEWVLETAAGERVTARARVADDAGGPTAVATVRAASDGPSAAEDDRAVFERTPIVFWEFDLSAVKTHVDRVAETVPDVHEYLAADPGRLEEVIERADVRDVNSESVEFYGASSKREVIERMDELITESALGMWRDLCVWLADGGTRYRVECEAELLTGERRTLSFTTFLPENGADDYSRVFMAGVDITERDRRERELETVRSMRRTLQTVLTEATPVDGVAESVCEALTGIDDVVAARVDGLDAADAPETLASAGVRPERSLRDDTDGGASDPGVVALEDGRTVVREAALGDGGTRAGPTTRVERLVAAPIRHGAATRGSVVAAVATDRLLGDDRVRSLIEETADVVGHAMGAADRRQALSAEEWVALTVTVETADSPLTAAVAEADAAATVVDAVSTDDASTLCHLEVDRSTDAVVDAARRTDGVESVRRLDPGADDRVQVVVEGPVPTALVPDHGGVVTSARVEGETTTLTARFPRETNPGPVLDAFATRFGGVRTTDYSTASVPAEGDGLLTGLTDRQREVLETAFQAGYFCKPRAQNAGEVAEGLGVSRPAFDQVLRAAQRNLLSDVFDDV